MSQNIRSVPVGSIYYQSGYGVPTHIATKGCTYIDILTATEYINKDGLVNWVTIIDTTYPFSTIAFTGGTVNGPTNFTNGLTANTMSASTYYGDGSHLTGIAGSIFTGGTVTGGANFTNGLTATTISASTYYNLPIDVTVTGGTYTAGTATFRNNTGGTFSVSGFSTDIIPHTTASGTDTYTATVSGVVSYNDGDAYLVRFTNGNTTTCTLNINSLGAIALYRNNDGNLIGGDIIAGAEMLCVYNSSLNAFQTIGTAPNTLLSYVTNADSVTLTKGMVVYAFGGTGDRMNVKRASNTGDTTSAQTVGLVLSSSIATNQKGLIMMQGLLDGLNILPTSTWNDGDAVYLGTNAGTITNVKQYAPNHLVYLGVVTTASNGSAGRMYVRVQNGYELDELHNVSATGATYGDLIVYSASGVNNLWVSTKTLTGNYTINGGLTITGNTSLNSLTATTISATTYQNLPTDIRITGGTYSSGGTATFTNNTGGTFSVTGFNATDYWVATGSSIYNTNTSQILIGGSTDTAFGSKLFVNGDVGITGSFRTNGYGAGAGYFVSDAASGMYSNDGSTLKFRSYNPSGNLFEFIPIYPSFEFTGYTQNIIHQSFTIAPVNAGPTIRMINLEPTINQTGSTPTIIHGIRIAPILTNAFDFRAIEVTSGSTFLQELKATNITATTVSATTYLNLPIDIRVTGATYSNNTFTYTNNTGGTFNTLFNTVTGLTVNGNLTVTGNTSLRAFTGTSGVVSGSSQNILTVVGSGNSTTPPIFSVVGSNGELFSVSDSLTGSLFSVNDISGLPIVEVFSNGTMLMGNYLAPSLNTTARINLTAGTNTIYSIPISAYTGAFIDYTVINSGNTSARAGNMMTIWTTGSTEFTDVSTNDIGSTSGITFSSAISGANALIRASATTTGWVLKTIIRSI